MCVDPTVSQRETFGWNFLKHYSLREPGQRGVEGEAGVSSAEERVQLGPEAAGELLVAGAAGVRQVGVPGHAGEPHPPGKRAHFCNKRHIDWKK